MLLRQELIIFLKMSGFTVDLHHIRKPYYSYVVVFKQLFNIPVCVVKGVGRKFPGWSQREKMTKKSTIQPLST